MPIRTQYNQLSAKYGGHPIQFILGEDSVSSVWGWFGLNFGHQIPCPCPWEPLTTLEGRFNKYSLRAAQRGCASRAEGARNG